MSIILRFRQASTHQHMVHLRNEIIDIYKKGNSVFPSLLADLLPCTNVGSNSTEHLNLLSEISEEKVDRFLNGELAALSLEG